VRRLASPQGQSLLRSLPAYSESGVLALQSTLRDQGLDSDFVAALLTQSRLRERAKTKFGEFAQGMLFTQDGLEQASRLEIAAAHAGRYRAASLATVHDLGCGIGSDAMAMSALGVTVHGIDADPVTAAVADSNLRPWPDSRAKTGRAEDFRPPVDAARSRVGVWLDPARRTPGVADINGRTRRIFRLDSISPSWDFVRSVAEAVPATGAKMSPSLPHDFVPNGAEAQWISYGGDVLECTIWFGPLVRHRGRSARILTSGAKPVEITEDMAEEAVPSASGLDDLGRWLYEPDRAVTRAGLLGALVARTGGAEVDPGLGYVTADTSVELPFATRYAVLEAMPFSIKTLRGWLREHEISCLTVKKRGIRLDDDQLRNQLKLARKGGEEAIVVLTRVAGSPTAIVVQPAVVLN
jgi:hypothetical protein